MKCSPGLAATGAILVALAVGWFWAESCPDVSDLKGRHVLITGASSGIGRELAQQYAALGARLTIVARRQPKLEQVRDLCLRAGSPGVSVVKADMGVAEEAAHAVDGAITAQGDIDVLVLNHAMVDDSLVVELQSEGSVQRHVVSPMRVNYEGSVRAATRALPSLQRRAGGIVVVSSGTAKTPAYFHAGYAASKGALHAFFDTMRAELRATGRGNVSVGLHVLGMIGTAEVLAEPALRSMAMPVSACARAMICHQQAGTHEAFIPSYLWIVVRLNTFFPGIADWIMRAMYVNRIPSLVARLAAV